MQNPGLASTVFPNTLPLRYLQLTFDLELTFELPMQPVLNSRRSVRMQHHGPPLRRGQSTGTGGARPTQREHGPR